MKKSTKLIPAIFYSTILVIITICAALFVIYRRGKETSLPAEKSSSPSIAYIPKFLFFPLHYLTDAT